MRPSKNNYAFIDSQNLNLAIRGLGWQLHFGKFRRYLREKYSVQQAYLFIGYDPKRAHLYTMLQSMGYICVFKPTLVMKDGSMKGNCDAELVLHTMIQFHHYDHAIIITGDGDFYCLVEHLLENKKLHALIIPNRFRYSTLLKDHNFKPFLRFMNDLEHRLSRKKEKTP